MARPDFFIVGAPRCGTTAMYEYLRQHPQIYMPEHKEPIYFGLDLTHLHGRLTEADYIGLFRNSKPRQRVGEASTWYLFSKTAAQEIRDFNPDAQIIAMFRNPVEAMYSLHRELVFYRAEPIVDFAEALEAEPERKLGRRLGPPGRGEMLYYRDTVRFAEQLARYYEVFGRDQVKVIIFDDFARDPAASYRDVLEFLSVDTSATAEFERVNESKRPLNQSLQELIVRPPAPIAKLVPFLRRTPIVHRLRAAILMANSRPAKRAPMDPDLRRRLTEEFAPEVERLGRMIGRDLSDWSRVDDSMLREPATA
jgi:hypothetical protein